MISAEIRVQIRHLFLSEHWKIDTISRELGIHPDAVRHAIVSDRFNRAQALRSCLTDPSLPFIRETLEQYPHLRAPRIFQMVRDRGYPGGVLQLRRVVADHGHRQVLVKGHAHCDEIVCGSEVIASRLRSHDRERAVYDPLHFLAFLEHKSRALDQAAPMAIHRLWRGKNRLYAGGC